MKNKLVLVLVVLILAGFTAAAFGAGAKEAPAAKQFKLSFSSVSVPNDAHTKAMYAFKEEIEKSTAGQITVDVYHSGQLFTQEADQPAVIKGTLDMCYTGPQWLTDWVPYMSMFGASYVFKDYTHMTKVMNGDLGKQVYEDIAKKIGMRILASYYLGTRHLNLRDIGREVRTPADMKGVKLRMPNSPAWLLMGRGLGANPTPLSFTEIYMALKTGTIDGQENPLPTNKNAKFYEVTKYIVLTGHYINPVMPCINEKKWQELGPALQAKMTQAIAKAKDVCDNTNLQAESELVEFFKKEGMTVIEPDKNAFIKFAQETVLNDKEATKNWDMDLYKKIQALVN
jgi:tripartite ATP-independent transporter DctP family solute receptor